MAPLVSYVSFACFSLAVLPSFVHASSSSLTSPSHPDTLSSGLGLRLLSKQKRDTNYLPNLVNEITTACQSNCTIFTTAVQNCITTGGTNDTAIAVCSCSKSVLKTVRDCAQCIATDKSSSFGQDPLVEYNGFISQCTSVGLANTSDVISLASTAAATSTAVTESYTNGQVITITQGAATNTAAAAAAATGTSSGGSASGSTSGASNVLVNTSVLALLLAAALFYV